MGAMVASAMPVIVTVATEGSVEFFSEAGCDMSFSERWGRHDRHHRRHKGCCRKRQSEASNETLPPFVEGGARQPRLTLYNDAYCKDSRQGCKRWFAS